jgi:hypothetical protein
MKQSFDEYLAELEEKEERKEYESRYDGSYQASKGDYEGAIYARDEFNSGRIS